MEQKDKRSRTTSDRTWNTEATSSGNIGEAGRRPGHTPDMRRIRDIEPGKTSVSGSSRTEGPEIRRRPAAAPRQEGAEARRRQIAGSSGEEGAEARRRQIMGNSGEEGAESRRRKAPGRPEGNRGQASSARVRQDRDKGSRTAVRRGTG